MLMANRTRKSSTDATESVGQGGVCQSVLHLNSKQETLGKQKVGMRFEEDTQCVLETHRLQQNIALRIALIQQNVNTRLQKTFHCRTSILDETRKSFFF